MTAATSNPKSGWKECKIGNIIELVGGGTPKTSASEIAS